MREQNCFRDYWEPTLIQLYNKIVRAKKLLKLTENYENTYDLRQKLEKHTLHIFLETCGIRWYRQPGGEL